MTGPCLRCEPSLELHRIPFCKFLGTSKAGRLEEASIGWLLVVGSSPTAT